MKTTAESNLKSVHLALNGLLCDIADRLPREYKLTLVARHTGERDADIILTDDELDSAIASIESLKARTAGRTGQLIVAEKAEELSAPMSQHPVCKNYEPYLNQYCIHCGHDEPMHLQAATTETR